MKKYGIFLLMLITVTACSVAVKSIAGKGFQAYEDSLRTIYSSPASQWPAAFIDAGISAQELSILPGSPLTDTGIIHHRIALGKILFFDTQLSGSNSLSCASCHKPELSWADNVAVSFGHERQAGKRNAPSLLNAWHWKLLFWDGRSNSLEDQAFSPINNESEMHSDMPEIMSKLRRSVDYRQLFEAAFGPESINPETMTEALATFERTLVSQHAAFDDFLKGDQQALTDAALRGLHIFRTTGRCMNCHNGPLFTDNDFHSTSLTFIQPGKVDAGRFKVTRLPADSGKFKTASLRDVMRTAPWLHDGSVTNMDTLIERYARGGLHASDPLAARVSRQDALIQPLSLSAADKKDLVAFLYAITAAPPVMK